MGRHPVTEGMTPFMNGGDDAGAGKAGQRSLADVSEPGRYLVSDVLGDERQMRRLSDMGFAVGMTVAVVACPAEGMVVVKVSGGRMALSRGTTQNVLVKQR